MPISAACDVWSLCFHSDLKNTLSPLRFDIVGKNILALFLQGTLFFLLNLLIEYNFFIKPRYIYSYNKNVYA